MSRTQDAHQRLAQGSGGALWPRFLNRLLSPAGEQEAGPDRHESFIVCRPLAEHGIPHAQNVLGEIYMYGEGISQDFDEAAKWFRLAAEQHHRRAQFMLGVLHWSGDGVPQDYDKAVKWFRLAEDRLSVANTQTDASGPGQDGAFGNE